ncbi:head completion protein [Rhizobium phage RHph_I46]|uniref:Head completion nuclease n=1 Tax=Rhizobium phage RHph_I1_9 TaxID=2509729 RepID=A0A7S5R9B0_9CAUD|nr:head closure [Rhizobium phage RHph_I1_9]QIG69620.1 head completion protein [Rhizobium phage RHph_I46]QIG70901.1 head completion protein [Rhizobium phage RHph_I9]QIG73487.1 head completion protein [Rhizobium phage RHph_I1_9]QIG76240.1 head completion protein [Rhizobium phage RHph_I34]
MAGRNTYKSVFECKNPHKYAGDPKNIICRSSWERFFATNLDNNPNVEKWASEELAIQYISPVDGKPHRYFVDFLVRFKDGNIVMVEIKPYGQTIPPVEPTKKSNKALGRYREELSTYLINMAKWKAASDFCAKNGMRFLVYTERELRSLGMPV